MLITLRHTTPPADAADAAFRLPDTLPLPLLLFSRCIDFAATPRRFAIDASAAAATLPPSFAADFRPRRQRVYTPLILRDAG